MWPVVGTEAVATGALTRGSLRWNYTAVYPNVYLPNNARRDLYINTVSAWLWTGRKGIVAGRGPLRRCTACGGSRTPCQSS